MGAPPSCKEEASVSILLKMATIYLSLGSNLGDRAANLRAAVSGLAGTLAIDSLSSVYETAPMYVTDQPPFLNMAAKAAGVLAPQDLLRLVKALEVRIGRQASRRYGPRLIDIDILFYDDVVLETPQLQLPHPRLAERAFVLCPLAEIAPGLIHPGLGASVDRLLAALDDVSSVRRLGALASVENHA